MLEPKLTAVLEAQGESLYWRATETGITTITLQRLGKARAQSLKFRVLDLTCDALHYQPVDRLGRSELSQQSQSQKSAPARKGTVLTNIAALDSVQSRLERVSNGLLCAFIPA